VNSRLVLSLAVAISAAAAVAAGQQNSAPSAKAKTVAAKSSVKASESAEGEKRFETHCGRCHVPPEDLSPREAKAVIRQMRVRANLSAEDQRLILRYLAP
jgi:cytochrome c5